MSEITETVRMLNGDTIHKGPPHTPRVYVPPGQVVDQMYSVLKMREYRIYFILLEKISEAINTLEEISKPDNLLDDRDFKYIYANNIRPPIRQALEEANVTVTTTCISFPEPVEDTSYIRLDETESSWQAGKTIQTPKRCKEVRNFIRGVAIHLANLAYTPYPDVDFLKRQSTEITAFREKCFLIPSKFE